MEINHFLNKINLELPKALKMNTVHVNSSRKIKIQYDVMLILCFAVLTIGCFFLI